jgi:2,4-dienoyl-CoA reductase-like NADH-dependent reductase (Old Yellow Enzyme family)
LVVGTGFSWLRQFAPNIAAATLDSGWADIIGFGREAFAYPDFAHDILYNNGFKKNNVCLTCGKCTDLKVAKKITGCVVRDKDVYLKPYLNI